MKITRWAGAMALALLALVCASPAAAQDANVAPLASGGFMTGSACSFTYTDGNGKLRQTWCSLSTPLPVLVPSLPLPAGAATSAKQDILIAIGGTTADSAWGGTGPCTTIACLKAIYNALLLPTPAGTNNIGSVTALDSGATDNEVNTLTASSATAMTAATASAHVTTAGVIDTTGYTAISFQVTANAGANSVAVYGSDDNAATWSPIPFRVAAVGQPSLSSWNTTSGAFQPQFLMQKMQVRITTFASGTTTVAVNLKRSAAPNSVEAYVANTVTTVATSIGNVASGATDSSNPVKIGGVYRATLPTFTDGQRGDSQMSNRGRLLGSVAIPYAGGDALANTAISSLVVSTGSADIGSSPMAVAGDVFNGTTWDRMRGDLNGTVNQPYGLAASRWTYAPATGGIANTTTASTFIAAAGAGVRNYVTSIEIDYDALTTATELAIRDGAAGTVLWRGKLPSGASGSRVVAFPVPLKGTANTLMEVVTLTASGGGAVYFNAQGFQGN